MLLKKLPTKTAVIIYVLFLSFSSITAQENFKVVGYMPSYRMPVLQEINFDFYTHLIASFINPNEDGEIFWDGNMQNFVSTVHANNTLAIASFGGGGDYSWGDKVSIYENLLATPESRTEFIHNIMNFLRNHDLDGIDNDMEGEALALNNYNIFTQELGDSVHAAGLEFSAAYGVQGYWGAGMVTDATLEKFDFVATMSYGGVGAWNWQVKNDENTIEKYESDRTYFMNRGVSKENIISGIAFYSVEFPAEAQNNYNLLNKTLCTTYNDPRFEDLDVHNMDTINTEEGNVVYLNSLNTIKRKIDIAKQNNSGIMIWEAGQECFNGSFALTDSLLAYMKSVGILSSSSSFKATEYKVFPNPTENSITITGLNFHSATVLDISGKTIQSTIASNPQHIKIDLTSFAKGIYIVNITYTNGESSQQKIVLK